MDASILTSIKKPLGIDEMDPSFDPDIIMFINTALMSLNQLGVGPKTGFTIEDDTTKWSDLLGEKKDLEGVKSYILLKVRLVFDPPQTGYLVDAINDQIKELEWRLTTQVEGGDTDGG